MLQYSLTHSSQFAGEESGMPYANGNANSVRCDNKQTKRWQFMDSTAVVVVGAAYDCGEAVVKRQVFLMLDMHTDDLSVCVCEQEWTKDGETEREKGGMRGEEEKRFYYFAYELRGPILFLRDSQLFFYYENNNNERAHILTIIRSYMARYRCCNIVIIITSLTYFQLAVVPFIHWNIYIATQYALTPH